MLNKRKWKTSVEMAGRLRAIGKCPWHQRDEVTFQGMEDISVHKEDGLLPGNENEPAYEEELAVFEGIQHNAFVNLGLDIMLDRLMGTNGPPAAISHMGVTDEGTSPTASTTQLDEGNAANTTVVAVQNKVAAASQLVSAEGNFTNSNANHAYVKVGFLNTSADDGSGLIDVIGDPQNLNTAPYDQGFTVDFTNSDSWDQTFKIELTATAV